jgi:hypothetical protein
MIMLSVLVVILVICLAALASVARKQSGLIDAQSKYIYTLETQCDLLKADLETYRLQSNLRGGV